MNLTCPQCREPIPLADVNVQADIALCRRCEKNFTYDEVSFSHRYSQVDLARPPKGTWYKQNPRGFEIGASTRHPIALALIPFTCIWGGAMLTGIFGQQIRQGKFDLERSLFSIPFLLVTILLITLSLLKTFGKVVVRVENNQVTIFTGVGPLGWNRKFKWNEFRAIRRTEKRSRNSSFSVLVIDADRSINFASGLNAKRLEFLLSALHQLRRDWKP